MSEVIDRRIAFNAGEISPWLDPRIDLDKYRMGCRTLQNMRPSMYGGALRRSGTEFMGYAENPGSAVRLVPFSVDADTAYVVEFSNLEFRVWNPTTRALLAVDSVPLVWDSPYTAAQLASLQFAQQNDVMFITHPAHPPKLLVRVAETEFAVKEMVFSWPPTLEANITTITIQPIPGALFQTRISTPPVTWLVGTAYALLTTVGYLGKYYLWVSASTGKTPDAAGNDDYWAEILMTVTGDAEPAAWVSGAYTAFTTVKGSNGKYYNWLLTHATAKDPTDAANSAYWVEVKWRLDTNVYKATEPTAWSSGVNYPTFTTVKGSNGKYYNWLQASTTGAPKDPINPANAAWWAEGAWTLLTAAGGPAAWSSSVQYNFGDRVQYSGKYYVYVSNIAGIGIDYAPGGRWDVKLNLWDQYYFSATVDSVTQRLATGNELVLRASESLFTADQVGLKWIVGHQRENLKSSIFLSSAVGTLSAELYVLGEWSATLTADNSGVGNWAVQVIIQRSYDLITWETHYPIVGGNSGVQAIVTGNEVDPVFLRIKLVSKTGTIPTQYKAEIEAGNPNHFGIVKVLSYISATEVTALVDFPLAEAKTTTRWEQPAWSPSNGYPRAVTLHDGRVYFGGTTRRPITLLGSAVDRYGDFRVAADADRAVSYTLQADEASVIEWLVSQDMLVIGTTGAEWVFGQRVGEDVAKLRRNTLFGSAPVQARAVNDSIVFLQRSRRKAREYAWSLERDGYAGNDLTMLAEHLGDASMTQLAIQRNPETVVWVTTSRGDLLSLTYERGQSVAGWARHVTDGEFESVAVVNGSGEDDHVWVVVKRTLNGAATRTIERFQPDTLRLLKDDDLEHAVYVDCALTVPIQPTVSVLVLGEWRDLPYTGEVNGYPSWGGTVNSLEVTLYGNSFEDPMPPNELFEFWSVEWQTVPPGATGATVAGFNGDGMPWAASWGDGIEVRGVSVGTGLDHLEGKQVAILANGNPHRDMTVTGGVVPMDFVTTLAVIGLPYDSLLEPTYLETMDSASVSKMGRKRLHRCAVEFWKSLGCELSADGGVTYTPINFRLADTQWAATPPLFSGILEEAVDAGTERQVSVGLRQRQALPMHIMSMGFRYEISMS